MIETREHKSLRELDHRTSDGIEVRLLWNSLTGEVSVAVRDTRMNDSFEFEVAAADALVAFQHPYAYANYRATAQLLAA